MTGDGGRPIAVAYYELHCRACQPWTATIRAFSTVDEVVTSILENREPEIDRDLIELARRVHERQHHREARARFTP
jgi:hypothetical protein